MRTDMENIPEELQTPENILCHEFDNGHIGIRIIKVLDEFGYIIVKKDEYDGMRGLWLSHS